MNRWICLAALILFHTSPAVLGPSRVLDITGSEKDTKVSVWTGDHVEIVARTTVVFEWFFNNITIAAFDLGSTTYIYPATSLLFNINASVVEDDSFLILDNVNRTYNGTYKADDNPDVYSLSMIVHEVNLSAIEFNMINDSDSCRAYLQVSDFIEPFNSEVKRMINSSYLTFNLTDPSNITSFLIDDSRLNVTDNSTNADINIQYIFASNNFTTVKSKTIYLEKLIDKPNIKMLGTPDNCTIFIQHNTSVQCVRNITYCLNTNEMVSECNCTSNLTNLTLEYPWNSTSANLSIVYDIIYAKYRFDIDKIQCTAEAITSVEPTTMNSSPPELTTTRSGTSDMTTSEGMTNYSDSTYSSMSPSMFSTYLDAVTILSLTASSELLKSTSSSTMNATGVPGDPEYLAEWQIALIVVGSFIGVLLLAGGIGCFLWKRKPTKTAGPENPLEVRSTSNGHVIRKSIPQSEPISRLQVQHDQRQLSPPRILSASSENTDGQQRHYERRRPEASDYDQTIRPSIPQPKSKSYDPSSRQESRYKRRQAPPINNGQYLQSSASRPVSGSPDLIYRQQVPYGRRRPLPPISNA